MNRLKKKFTIKKILLGAVTITLGALIYTLNSITRLKGELSNLKCINSGLIKQLEKSWYFIGKAAGAQVAQNLNIDN